MNNHKVFQPGLLTTRSETHLIHFSGQPEADVAELADALASGASDRKVVEVRLLSSASIYFAATYAILADTFS